MDSAGGSLAPMSATDSVADVIPAKRTFTLQGGVTPSGTVAITATMALDAILYYAVYRSFNRWMAWGLAAMNVAFLAWIWYAMRPGKRSLLKIGAGQVEVRLAYGTRCRFPLATISAADPAPSISAAEPARGYLNTAYPLEPNVLIVLGYSVNVRLAVGVHRDFRIIGIRVENPDAVLAMLRVPIASGQGRS
jgi:hypothetical protein